MEKSAELNKENCVKWLADIGASTSGSKQELTMRINQLSSLETQGKVRQSLRISL